MVAILRHAGSMARVSRFGDSEKTSTPSTINTPSGMNEKVMSFCSSGDNVEVTFSKSAMIFQLPVDRDNFTEVMAALAKAYKEKSEVKYVQKGQELVSVTIQ
jgi:hypothetical protein